MEPGGKCLAGRPDHATAIVFAVQGPPPGGHDGAVEGWLAQALVDNVVDLAHVLLQSRLALDLGWVPPGEPWWPNGGGRFVTWVVRCIPLIRKHHDPALPDDLLKVTGTVGARV